MHQHAGAMFSGTAFHLPPLSTCWSVWYIELYVHVRVDVTFLVLQQQLRQILTAVWALVEAQLFAVRTRDR